MTRQPRKLHANALIQPGQITLFAGSRGGAGIVITRCTLPFVFNPGEYVAEAMRMAQEQGRVLMSYRIKDDNGVGPLVMCH